jgi:DNA polymerase-3 subunit delta'
MPSTERFSLFDSVIGHRSQIEELRSLASGKSIPHALLFTGPQGIGKRRIAFALAAALCVNPGQLQNEIGLAQKGNHPDIHWCVLEEGKKDISVESIRSLCSSLRLNPYSGQAAVAIIDNAHLMSISAANALLMTLEEPATKSHLILISHVPHRLLETIVSRCQLMHFAPLSPNEISSILDRLLGSQVPTASLGKLNSLNDGTLNPFELAPFVDPRSLELKDEAGATEQVKGLLAHLTELERALTSLCDAPEPAAQALSTASQLSAKVDSPESLFRIIISFYRAKMKQSKSKDAKKWAELLESALDASQAVQARNANLNLQLSSLFLKTTGQAN